LSRTQEDDGRIGNEFHSDGEALELFPRKSVEAWHSNDLPGDVVQLHNPETLLHELLSLHMSDVSFINIRPRILKLVKSQKLMSWKEPNVSCNGRVARFFESHCTDKIPKVTPGHVDNTVAPLNIRGLDIFSGCADPSLMGQFSPTFWE
jgi:hypothetical protein